MTTTDDGYQGSPATTSPSEAALLALRIADLDQAAWDYEDREQHGRASSIRDPCNHYDPVNTEPVSYDWINLQTEAA